MKVHREGRFILNKGETLAAVDDPADIEHSIKFFTAVLKFLVEESRNG